MIKSRTTETLAVKLPTMHRSIAHKSSRCARDADRLVAIKQKTVGPIDPMDRGYDLIICRTQTTGML